MRPRDPGGGARPVGDGEGAPGSTIAFVTRSGTLEAVRDGALVELDFPARPATAHPPDAGLARTLAAILGCGPARIGRSEEDLLVELGTAHAVRALEPDLAGVRDLGVRGLIVTAAADDTEHDFVSRFFAPAVGVDEDPVTGSAHCTLGLHWAQRLGRDELRGYQASARGGTVRVRVRGDRVGLGGSAVTWTGGCWPPPGRVTALVPDPSHRRKRGCR